MLSKKGKRSLYTTFFNFPQTLLTQNASNKPKRPVSSEPKLSPILCQISRLNCSEALLQRMQFQ